MLTQQHLLPPLTRTVKSLFTHAHSSLLSWLPGYIDVTQTLLIILAMAGLFPDRPLIKNFPDKEKLKEFITTKPVLYEMLKGLL